MKKYFSIFLFLFLSVTMFAQVSVDPNDKFYKEAQGWEMKGLIDTLPLVRPYPTKIIKKILNQVINCGSKQEAELALTEYERIFSKPYNLYVEGGFKGKYKDILSDEKAESEFTKAVNGEVGIAGDIIFSNLVDMGFNLGWYGTSADWDDLSYFGQNPEKDSIYDPASVGPIEFFLDWNTLLSFGSEEIYISGGISRIGYGPFLGEGLALNDSAYHAPNIMFNVTRQKWSYSSVYETIGATTNIGDDLEDNKYLAFHALKYRFNPKFHITYYENILFGPQNDIIYLVPAPYMAVQNIGGASSNLQMGLLLEIKPVSYLNWATDIFVDDFDVNEVVKLNFDSKLRFGLQSGFIFTPKKSSLTYMSMSYTAIMPYTYAHWEYEQNKNGTINGDVFNYQNYTNNGLNIGSSLPPNSDRISFNASFNPAKNLTLSFATSFIRHQNTAEQFSDEEAAKYVLSSSGQYKTDGSVFMHQMFSAPDDDTGEHVDQAWERLGFMTGKTTMKVCQASISGEYRFPKTKKGQFSIKAGYTFELTLNHGVGNNMYKGMNFNVEPVSVGKDPVTGEEMYNYKLETASGDDWGTYESIDDLLNSSELQKEVSAQKQEWLNNLTDKVTHYFTVSLKYSY